MIYSYRPPKNKKGKRTTIIGVVLVAVLIGLFLFKYNKNKSDKQYTLNNNQETNKNTEAIAPFITAEEVYLAINNNLFQIVDTRSVEEFELEHIESSLNVPLKDENNFAKYLLNKKKTIIIISKTSDNGLAQKIVKKLIAENYQAKYLKGGIDSFSSAGYELISYGNVESSKDKSKVVFISAEELLNRSLKGENFIFLDVRKKEDFNKNRIENSTNIPLEILEKNKKEIPAGKIIVVDENPVRSFRGAVQLFDMNIIGVYCLEGSLSNLKEIIENNNNSNKNTEINKR